MIGHNHVCQSANLLLLRKASTLLLLKSVIELKITMESNFAKHRFRVVYLFIFVFIFFIKNSLIYRIRT